MDVEEKLIESHKAISKVNGTLLTLIFVMSVYVMQRALAVIGFSPDLFRSLVGETVQIDFLNLGFSYRTMTVLWPGILGGACVIYTILEGKRRRIETSLKRLTKEMRGSDIVELDPFYVTGVSFRSRSAKATAHLFAAFPMLAIAIHVLMIATWGVTLGWHAVRHSIPSEYLPVGFSGVSAGAVFSLSSTLFSVVGFFGTLFFWKVMKEGFEPTGSDGDKHKPSNGSRV